MTADCRDMQGQLNLVWDKLLPAFQAQPLPADAAAEAKLKQTLEKLSVREGHIPNSLNLPGASQRAKK